MPSSAIASELQGFYEDIGSSPEDFLCVYGSTVYEPGHTTSDVDLFLASDASEHHQPGFVDAMSGFIRQMHNQYGLEVDDEVPFDNKLVYYHADVSRATSLECFEADECNQVVVPPVEKSREFLHGKAIKLRLALNALTSPHLFIGQNNNRYDRHRQAAEIAITATGLSLCGSKVVTEDNIKEALTCNDLGQTGEYHLGYKAECPVVSEHLGIVVSNSVRLFERAGILSSTKSVYHIPSSFNPSKIARTYTLKGEL